MNNDTLMGSRQIFENSIIVAAHPDDEVLWFSSILDEVDVIVICFLNYKTKHEKSVGRQRALSQHPKKNICCLALEESDAFWDVDWHNPVISPFGLEISRTTSGKDYKENYFRLKDRLREKLRGCRNVFTHNPWGEYGHVDHVQVYRVIKELQEEMKFSLWFTNYCSNKSLNLLLKYCDGFGPQYITLETNKALAGSIKMLYEKNNCWSWFSDHEWCNEESFIQDEISDKRKTGHRQIYPLHFINLELSGESGSNMHFGKRVSQLFNRFIRKRSIGVHQRA